MLMLKKINFVVCLNATLCASFVLLTGAIQAANAQREPFKGENMSGVYSCHGNDTHDGDFSSTMTLSLDEKYSSGQFGAYKVIVRGEHDEYTGSIVATASQLAMDFANKDASKRDFGVTLATLTRLANGKYKIEKFYYQPLYMGGSNGFELCEQK